MTKYSPTTLFRGIGSQMLKQAFDKAGIELAVDWENRDRQKDKSVAKAWAAFDAKASDKEKACRKLHAVFQLVWNLGTAKYDVKKLCRVYEECKALDHPLPSDFDDMGKFEIGMYLHLNENAEILERMVEHVAAHDKSRIPRHWRAYQADAVDIEVSENLLKSMARLSDAFFIPEGKGGETRIENYPRLDDKLTYFIAKLDDPETTIEGKLKPGEEFTDLNYIPPYEVIFSYDSQSGRFMIHVPGLSAAKTHKLASALIKLLTGQERDPQRLSRPEYDMSKFAVPRYNYPSMMDRGYSAVRTEIVWIRSAATPNLEYAIKEVVGNDAYDSIGGNQVSNKLIEAKFDVSRVAIVMQPAPDSGKKKIRFELSEKTCTHPDLDLAQVRVVEELLDRMEIEA